jgi:hypothetical protein
MTLAAQNRILILGSTNILSKKMVLSKFFLPTMVSMRQKFRAHQKYSSFQFRHYLEVLKGTVPPDFSPLVFFFKQLLLALVDKPSNDFDFFRIFAEILDFSCASPVSLTPAKQMILL